MKTLQISSSAVLVVMLAACGDQIQFAEPPRRAAQDAPSAGGRIDPHGSPDGNPERVAPNPHAGSGGADPFEEEQDANQPAVAPSARSTEVVEHYSGTVTLGPGVEVPPGCTLFIMAKRADVRQPTMVTRIENVTFPAAFRLTSKDVFGSDTTVDQPLQLGIIVSAGQDVAPVPGRFYKRHYFDELYAPGTRDVRLVLNP